MHTISVLHFSSSFAIKKDFAPTTTKAKIKMKNKMEKLSEKIVSNME